MKYIRTKDDRIIRITEKGCIKEFNNKLYAFRDSSFSYRFENGYEVVKQADAIEELCDELVRVVHYIKEARPFLIRPYKYADDYNKGLIIELEEQKKMKLRGDNFDIFGAIWTNNGLKYVAKMNEKGEFELL